MAKTKSIAQMEREYHKLARRADDRLRTLEKYSNKEGYGAVKEYAYKNAMRMIRKYSGPEANRFNTKVYTKAELEKNPAQAISRLERKIEDINQFLDMPTSKISDINKLYKGRADIINKRYGTDYKWNDLADLYNSELYKKMSQQLGSKTALRQIATLQKDKSTILKALEEGRASTVTVKGHRIMAATREALEKSAGELIKLLG